MGNDQCGAADHGFVQCRLNHFFTLCVERTGRLVQQQQWGIFQNRPCNRNALALTARQTHTPIAQVGIKTLRQLADELLRISRFSGSVHVFQAGVWAAIADVLDHGTGKNHRLLGHDGHALTQGVQVHLVDRHPVQHDAARLRVVKAHQQIEQSGFARAARADHGHGLTGMDLACQLVQCPGVGTRGVMKANRFQLQGRAALRPGRLLWLVGDLQVRLGVQQLHQALGRSGCAQQVAVNLAQHRKGAGQQDHIKHRLAQLTGCAGARAHSQRAHVKTPKQHGTGGHDDETHQHGTGADAAQRRAQGTQGGVDETTGFAALGGVALHHADGVEHLGSDGAGIGHAVLVGAREAAHTAAEVNAWKNHRHQHRHHLQHQDRVGPHQHEQRTGAHDQVAQAHGKRRAHHGLHQRGVVGEAREHFARLRGFKKGRTLLQHMAIHRVAQVGGDALTQPAHGVVTPR